HLPSMVFWGPPGSGKTTLARIIASLTQSHFELVSAVASGVADLRRVVAEAGERLGEQAQRTILFIDEIHRFNKAQQDVVLPYVEDGTITLIGATTENPSFEVISPLLSRSRVFKLEPLTPEQVEGILKTALADEERGLGSMQIEVEDETLSALAKVVGGDARIALNALELAVQTAPPEGDGVRRVTVERVEDAQRTLAEPVPLHLRNAPTPLMRNMGHGRDYEYDHAFPGHYSGQEHLPEQLRGRQYYLPGELGYEERVREWMERLRGRNRNDIERSD